jgi:branched-chain amino acid aminotransferase
MNIFYIDGNFVDSSNAVLPVEDLAVLRGLAVFDFTRTYNGIPFHLDQHLQRLQRSARLVGLTLPHSREELAAIITETLKRNDHGESNIRIVVTGGSSEDGVTPDSTPRLLVLVTPVIAMPGEWYRHGAKVITARVDRYLPIAKTTNYLSAVLCQAEARSRGAVEAVYVDRDGYLLEATTCNLFVRLGDTLLTPPCDRILPGITRQVVLQLATEEGPAREQPLHLDQLRLFDEAFLTSSTKEIMPVAAIDGTTIGDGHPGPLTRRLMARFAEYTAAYRG